MRQLVFMMSLHLQRQQNPEDSNYVKECQKFLQFLFKTCLSSIHPEFTYQRKKTALDMYGTMLNTFFDHRKNVPVCEVRKYSIISHTMHHSVERFITLFSRDGRLTNVGYIPICMNDNF